MTTIAFDGKMIAADMLHEDNFGLIDHASKLHFGKDFVAGGAGMQHHVLGWWRKVKDMTFEEVVDFGHPDYEDYTTHKDPSRKENYLKRHKARETWQDLSTPGAWSRHLLWSEPSIEDAARRMQKRFNVDITLEI